MTLRYNGSEFFEETSQTLSPDKNPYIDVAANLVLMETISTGQIARLPDGQRIIIDEVYSDGYVSARRIEGEWQGTVVVCAISKLQPDNEKSAFT